MKDVSCELARVGAMVMADGHQPDLPPNLINSHLAACEECRLEIADLNALVGLLDAQERRGHPGDLWPAIARRLSEKTANRGAHSSRPAFILLGLTLVVYKLVELVPESELGVYAKLIPIVLVIAVFSYIKENPFRISTELEPEE
jgi:predicted anti-sigma-YlaC factor YlaD